MDNTYSFGLHTHLSPNELLFYVFIDETCKEFGVDNVSAAAAALTRRNRIPARTKPSGATKQASVESIVGHRSLNCDLKSKTLPTRNNQSIKELNTLMTQNIGKCVGRALPLVGYAVPAHHVVSIKSRSVANYNRRVKPEDRIF